MSGPDELPTIRIKMPPGQQAEIEYADESDPQDVAPIDWTYPTLHLQTGVTPALADLLFPAVLPVAGVRVTFFPGIPMPWVEIWTREPGCGEGDPFKYPYYDINRPVCETQEQWLALLATGRTTVLNPAPEAAP